MGTTSKAKLLKELNEIDLKLKMFLEHDNGRYDDVIAKFKKQKDSIKMKLELLDEVKDVEVEPEVQVDSSLQRMMNKFDSEMEIMEFLKGNGREYNASFKRAKKLKSKIEERLFYLNKIEGFDIEKVKSKKYREFARIQEMIEKQLQEDALASKMTRTELTEEEKLQLLNASFDASIGLVGAENDASE